MPFPLWFPKALNDAMKGENCSVMRKLILYPKATTTIPTIDANPTNKLTSLHQSLGFLWVLKLVGDRLEEWPPHFLVSPSIHRKFSHPTSTNETKEKMVLSLITSEFLLANHETCLILEINVCSSIWSWESIVLGLWKNEKWVAPPHAHKSRGHHHITLHPWISNSPKLSWQMDEDSKPCLFEWPKTSWINSETLHRFKKFKKPVWVGHTWEVTRSRSSVAVRVGEKCSVSAVVKCSS